MILKYTLIFLTLRLLLFGQELEINQLNKKGKKHGEWIVYLDERWNKVNDTSKAAHIAYDYYINGKSYCSKIGNFKMPKYHESTDTQKVLNGEHIWYDKAKRLNAKYYFSNGRIDSIKHYTKSGELEFLFNFKTKYQKDPFTYLMYWIDPKTKKNILFVHREYLYDKYRLLVTDPNDLNINWK